jgi:hypothetical protein
MNLTKPISTGCTTRTASRFAALVKKAGELAVSDGALPVGVPATRVPLAGVPPTRVPQRELPLTGVASGARGTPGVGDITGTGTPGLGDCPG